jgi:hypothetical protein
MKTAFEIAEMLDRAGYTLRREFSGKFGPSDPGCCIPEVIRELGLIEMVDLKTSQPRIRATNAQLTEFDWVTNLVRRVLAGPARASDRYLIFRKAGMVRLPNGKWAERKQKALAREFGVHRHTIRHRLTALYVELSNGTKLIQKDRVPDAQIAA